ncbi:hypothetical protein J2Z83_000736 [Virgibacillus natechei]|uniref:Uncharacterized protein n=1 Tax=Virgibacillus natechei TaxID=1216297 RepID=A0ABS4ICH3_9BACI|nr:hypothetical protein [Virgibacillus natechei]
METGEFDKQYYTGLDKGGDGLYWRIFDNGVLQMFGLDGVFNPEGDSLTFEKTIKAYNKYSNPLEVNVEYNNEIIYSEVVATAESELYMPAFLKNILSSDSNSLKATSSRVVTETPELIRTFNFAKYLWKATGLQDVAEGITNSIDEFFSN